MYPISLNTYPVIKDCLRAFTVGIALYQGLKIVPISKDLRCVIAISGTVISLIRSQWERNLKKLTEELNTEKNIILNEKQNESQEYVRIGAKKEEECRKLQLQVEDLIKQNQELLRAHEKNDRKGINQEIQSLKEQSEQRLIANNKLEILTNQLNEGNIVLIQENATLRYEIEQIRSLKKESTKQEESFIEKEENYGLNDHKIQEHSSCTLEIVTEIPEDQKQDASIIYITKDIWNILTNVSGFFKAFDSNPTMKRTIEHSKEVVSFTIRSLISKEKEDRNIWKEKINNPILKALIKSESKDWSIFGNLEDQVNKNIHSYVSNYFEQVLFHLEFALEIQSEPCGVQENTDHEIVFWQERFLDLAPLIDENYLKSLVELCNRYCDCIFPLRVLEDLCLTKIIQTNPELNSPLALSYIRIGSKSDEIKALFENNSITSAETILIEFTGDKMGILSDSDKALAQEILKKPVSFLFLTNAINYNKLISVIKNEQFPFMFILNYNKFEIHKWTFCIKDDLKKSKEAWRFNFISKDNKVILYRESDRNRCMSLYKKYFMSDDNGKDFSIETIC